MKKLKEINKKIEDVVVNSYKKTESAAVGTYKKIEDKFVDTFLKKDNETLEDAKERIKKEQENLNNR